MNTLQAYAHNFFFNVYPYMCLAVFLMGSLRASTATSTPGRAIHRNCCAPVRLRWGSNLFHVGILFLLMGHTVGLLTPHWLYEPFISPERKQVMAVVAGGIAGVICFIGLTLLCIGACPIHASASPAIALTSRS
jgi:nitrate reductase gamma subunit